MNRQDVIDVALVLSIFALVALIIASVMVYQDNTQTIPVARFYGNNTLGVYCTRGFPNVTQRGTEVIVKCIP